MKLLSVFTVVILVGASCAKDGAQGPKGEDGANGLDGSDGTAGCIQCHTSDENMKIKAAEWSVSAHVTGGHMSGYYASRDGCADCHSSQGFQEVVTTGIWDNPAPDKPLPANCYTCHEIHETYTDADWNFRVSDDGIAFLVNDYVSDQSKANTCIQCHQSRIAEPALDINATTDVTITSKRYGPHHGPQGNMAAGVGNSGAYELLGSMSYSNSMHATNEDVNCVSCHLASGAGSGGNFELGGHSNNVSTGDWTEGTKSVNVNGCIACHADLTSNGDATDFVSSARDANLILIDNLRVALYGLGYLDDDDYVANNNITISDDNQLTVSQQHAAAIYNFKFVTEDQSTLIHNPMYAKALIQNSIEALQ